MTANAAKPNLIEPEQVASRFHHDPSPRHALNESHPLIVQDCIIGDGAQYFEGPIGRLWGLEHRIDKDDVG